MFALTTPEAAMISVVVIVVTVGLVLAVLVLFPRALRAVPAIVTCPMMRRRVYAELMRDDWTLHFTDVTRCAVLGADVRLCNKACRSAGEAEIVSQSRLMRSRSAGAMTCQARPTGPRRRFAREIDARVEHAIIDSRRGSSSACSHLRR
jgi:hypothetical protein